MRSRARCPRSVCRVGPRRVGLWSRTGRKREPKAQRPSAPEPDPVRSRHRRFGSAVRVAGDAVHEQRLPEELDRRGRLQLDPRGRRQERGRSADRRRDRGPQAANGQVQGRRDRALARHLGDVRLPHQWRRGRAAAARTSAHYINVDGQDQNPGVPTLAVWAGRGTPGRHMDGAQNVTIPNQTHVQTCTLGRVVPRVLQVPDRTPARRTTSSAQNGSIEIAGKALNFPQNTGLRGRDGPGLAGQRQRAADDGGAARVDRDHRRLGGGGAWGPVPSRQASATSSRSCVPALPTLHIYYEPFVRSDYTLRLLASPAIEQLHRQPPGQHVGRQPSGTRSCGATRAPRTTSC